MDSVEYNFRFIHRYLAKQLNPRERQAFEAELLSNPELQRRLWEQMELGEAVGGYLDEKKIPKSVALPDEGSEPKGVRKLWYERPLVWAAVVAVLILTGLWISNLSQQNVGPELYAQNYQHMKQKEYSGAKKGRNTAELPFSGLDSALFSALESYERTDYLGAKQQFSDYINSGRDHLKTGKFYRALTALKLNDTKQAIADFIDYLLLGSEAKYFEDAKWYLALSYLKEGRLEEAKKQLEELSGIDGPYQAKSTKLLVNL